VYNQRITKELEAGGKVKCSNWCGSPNGVAQLRLGL